MSPGMLFCKLETVNTKTYRSSLRVEQCYGHGHIEPKLTLFYF